LEGWMPLKVKFFLWLDFNRQQWTMDRRQRHGLEITCTCPLCDQEVEMCDHLFVSWSEKYVRMWSCACRCSLAVIISFAALESWKDLPRSQSK
jgi:hypothetical protein